MNEFWRCQTAQGKSASARIPRTFCFQQLSNTMKPKKPIESLILTLRGQKVILDADLAELYGVPTKRFNEAFKRNRERFPDDFAFQLTAEEFAALRTPDSSPMAMSSSQPFENEGGAPNWSQIATGSPTASPMRSQIATASKRNIRHRPHAFTEHGAIMAATVLNSPEAVAMSVFVVRAFMQTRAASDVNGLEREQPWTVAAGVCRNC
jgi:hypothetical protein